ncbi:NAD(P)-dependent alcohol dehydrogenase [Nocardioides sp. NPDC087217]|uniref:NAD(P)-dependent alcohol dehydrogenase n=1 Tax=Nocardioides sp. NPDC087217 TaxID=3364335 RepID=UPI00380629DF
MLALTQRTYGGLGAVTMEDLPVPAPAPDEVLVKVHACSLNGSDRENLAGSPFYSRLGGLRRPKHPVPGSDIAGVVSAVGAEVGEYAVGDAVFGELAGYRGGLAEYVATRPALLARKPPGLTYAEAAAIPQAGGIAVRAIEGRVTTGDRVLVNGAGGAGGPFVVGLAAAYGAEVTAVDRGEKADFLRAVGASAVIDYPGEDWADQGDRYDLIVDLVAHRSPFRVHRALRRSGSYLLVGGSTRTLVATLLAGPMIRATTGKRVGVLVVPQAREHAESAATAVAEEQMSLHIDSTFPLSEAVAAYERLTSGANHGKIVVVMPE